jgi:hypothetical protein
MLKLTDEFAPDGVFDPETVDILVGAFDDAWKSAQVSGAPIANGDYAARAREILAKAIIEMAANGEQNRRKLTKGTLLQLSRTPMRKSSDTPGR